MPTNTFNWSRFTEYLLTKTQEQIGELDKTFKDRVTFYIKLRYLVSNMQYEDLASFRETLQTQIYKESSYITNPRHRQILQDLLDFFPAELSASDFASRKISIVGLNVGTKEDPNYVCNQIQLLPEKSVLPALKELEYGTIYLRKTIITDGDGNKSEKITAYWVANDQIVEQDFANLPEVTLPSFPKSGASPVIIESNQVNKQLVLKVVTKFGFTPQLATTLSELKTIFSLQGKFVEELRQVTKTTMSPQTINKAEQLIGHGQPALPELISLSKKEKCGLFNAFLSGHWLLLYQQLLMLDPLSDEIAPYIHQEQYGRNLNLNELSVWIKRLQFILIQLITFNTTSNPNDETMDLNAQLDIEQTKLISTLNKPTNQLFYFTPKTDDTLVSHIKTTIFQLEELINAFSANLDSNASLETFLDTIKSSTFLNISDDDTTIAQKQQKLGQWLTAQIDALINTMSDLEYNHSPGKFFTNTDTLELKFSMIKAYLTQLKGFIGEQLNLQYGLNHVYTQETRQSRQTKLFGGALA